MGNHDIQRKVDGSIADQLRVLGVYERNYGKSVGYDCTSPGTHLWGLKINIAWTIAHIWLHQSNAWYCLKIDC